MTIAREELKKMTLAAASAEEIVEIVKAAGEEITAEEAEHIFKKAQEKKADKEFSPDELDAVSGGADRDWAVDDCAATVERGSWCGSNDKCIHFEVTYEHLPCGDCPYCDGIVYEYSSFEGVYKCKKCGRISGRNAWMVDLP